MFPLKVVFNVIFSCQLDAKIKSVKLKIKMSIKNM